MVRLFDEMHRRARNSLWLARLAVGTRILLAAAFLPTGLVKVLHQRFTSLPPTHPAGEFFEALYQTGGYWQFLGWTQVLAAVMLLVPATSTIGALLFLGIATNIFVITTTLDFAGTPFITGPMLLAALFLVCWDYHRWKGLLFSGAVAEPPPPPFLRWRRLERWLLTLGGSAGMLFFLGTRGLMSGAWAKAGLVIAALGAVALGIVWIAQDVDRARRNRGQSPQGVRHR